MKTEIEEKRSFDGIHSSIVAFWMISLMHDNPVLPLLRNPYKLLEKAGLRPGQRVVEVGCGPGFFTIPAAKIVGEEGIVYALDVNQRFIRRVEGKMRKYGLTNIKPVLGNAADSGLQDSSIDLAFIIGLPHVAGGLSNLLLEMYRILKTRGTLAFEKSRGSDDKLVEEVERAGFVQTDKKGRFFIFSKKV